MSTPTLAQLQYDIGTRIGRADWEGAAASAEVCRAAWPNDPSGWLLGSMAALFADQKAKALSLIEERLAVDPGDAQCLLQQGECLLALGERDRATAAAEAAAAAAPNDPDALDAAATFLAYAGEYHRALQVFDRAVEAAPRDPTVLSRRAAAHQYLGHFDLAAGDYQAALALAPTDAIALKGLAQLRRQSEDGNAIAAMQTALAAASNPVDAAHLNFGLAKSYEDLGDYPSSWKHLQAGNKLERARLQYKPAQDRLTIERIISAFPELEVSYPDSTGEKPIFILGLPRTGTTLVERIIGSHSAVHSAGESAALAHAVSTVADRTAAELSKSLLGYIDAWGGIDAALVAKEYLARIQSRRGDRQRFSDKTTLNFFYCALIFRAFPNARIVHLTRHPLATCYAIFKMRFNGGFPFSYDLGELGDFYLGYRRLMAHWHRIVPNRILDVAYEEVVTRQEATTRRLLEYLDLPFEEACLDFHLNPNSTSTLSSVQVRQPLYNSSLEQWRHYAAELAPLRERLAAGGITVPE